MTTNIILKATSKNLLAFGIGSIVGLLSTFITVPLTLYSFLQTHTGVGAVAGLIVLIPVLFIIYGVLGFIIGGVLGVIIYRCVRSFSKVY